jgi:hypothetical protein
MIKAVAKAGGPTLSTRSRRWARRARMGSDRDGTQSSSDPDVGALALLTVSGAGAARPKRPVTLIVASPARGPVDALARLVSPGTATALGQPAMAQNVPGAAGVDGLKRLVHSLPDGRTLALSGDAAGLSAPAWRRARPMTRVATLRPSACSRPRRTSWWWRTTSRRATCWAWSSWPAPGRACWDTPAPARAPRSTWRASCCARWPGSAS